MRVLVTGAHGFAGRHLTTELSGHNHDPILFGLNPAPQGGQHADFRGDIRDAEAVATCLKESAPEGIVHLAGIAFVPTGWSDPDLVFSVNLLGTVNLLEQVRKLTPSARVVVVTSGEVYGHPGPERSITEESPLVPDNLYGVSKAAADNAALLIARQYNLDILTARPFNHIGPGQSSSFMAIAFARQVARIARGDQEPVIKVGNLESRKDFTDVRDVVRAYRLLLEKGRSGEGYNIASGHQTSVREILDQFCEQAGISPAIQLDPDRFRPAHPQPDISTSKLSEATGWSPVYNLSQSIKDIVESVQKETTLPLVKGA